MTDRRAMDRRATLDHRTILVRLATAFRGETRL
jgi:hypothetical protein